MTHPLKFVRYNLEFINNRIRYNRVSLYSKYLVVNSWLSGVFQNKQWTKSVGSSFQHLWFQFHKTSYEQLFYHRISIQTASFYLHFWFILIWYKEIDRKVAIKMLLKLTPYFNYSTTKSYEQFTFYVLFSLKYFYFNFFACPGVNFTNILRAPFSYVSFMRSFLVLAVKVKLFIGAIAPIKCWWNWLQITNNLRTQWQTCANKFRTNVKAWKNH